MNIYWVTSCGEPFGLYITAETRGRAKEIGRKEMSGVYQEENYTDMRAQLCAKNITEETDERVIYDGIEDEEILKDHGLRYATEEEIEAAGY